MAAKIKLVKRLFQHFPATVVYSVTYVSEDESTLVQLQIRSEPAGFSVLSLTATNKLEGVLVETLASGLKQFDANALVVEHSVCLDQQGLDWLSGPTEHELLDLSLEALSHRPSSCFSGFEFYASNHDSNDYFSQKLKSGIRLLLQHDGSDSITVRQRLDCQPQELTGPARESAARLFRVAGYRGALLDVLLCGDDLQVLDAAYFADRWLDDLPLNERLGFVERRLKDSGIKADCILMPEIMKPESWLSLNDNATVRGMLVRKANSLPVFCRAATEDQVTQFQASRATYLLSQYGAKAVVLTPSIGSNVVVRCSSTFGFLFNAALPHCFKPSNSTVNLLSSCQKSHLIAS